MPDLILKNFCGDTPFDHFPEGEFVDGYVAIRCPICGRSVKLFPAGVMERLGPSEYYVDHDILAKAVSLWNNHNTQEVDNG